MRGPHYGASHLQIYFSEDKKWAIKSYKKLRSLIQFIFIFFYFRTSVYMRNPYDGEGPYSWDTFLMNSGRLQHSQAYDQIHK